MLRFAKRFLGWALKTDRQRESVEEPFAEPEEENNPYLPQLKQIIRQVLKQKGIPYEQFSPILIDGGDSKDTLMAAKLLGGDLNRLAIVTDRPAYFEEYADSMYEEQGLITEIFCKDPLRMERLSWEENCGNVILDFEKKRDRSSLIKFGGKLYIPIFKRRWEEAGNLDIAVPIGYNIVTVRRSKEAEKNACLDKFERAFYENE